MIKVQFTLELPEGKEKELIATNYPGAPVRIKWVHKAILEYMKHVEEELEFPADAPKEFTSSGGVMIRWKHGDE